MVLFALDIWESPTSVETLQGLLCYKHEKTERKNLEEEVEKPISPSDTVAHVYE